MQDHLPHAMRFVLPHVLLVAVMLVSPAMMFAPNTPLLEDEHTRAPTGEANTSGWLASAGGSSSEQVNAMVPLSNGTMIVAGSFEQTIDFHGDVVGFSSEDSSYGIDFYLGWIDEHGNWTSSKQGNSWGFDSISAMDVLSDGTVIVAGTFCEVTMGDPCNMTLGTLPPLNKSNDNHETSVFLAAMTPFGGWLWAKSFSNEYQTSIVDLVVTPTDDIHLGILHRGELMFDNFSSPASITQDAVALVMMDNLGDYIGVHTVFSSDTLDSTGVLCMDGNGATYFATSFTDVIVFGDNEINSTGGLDVAVGLYNNDAWVWVSHAGGGGENTVTDCAGLPNGGVAIVGDYLQDMMFGSLELDDAVWIDFYEAHVSSSGDWLHATGFGGSGAERVRGIVVTAQGDSIVVGEMTGDLSLGEFSLTDRDGVNDGNHFDVFMAQRQANGPWDWAISAGGNGNDLPTSISLSSSGSPVVAFTSTNDGDYGPHAFEHRDAQDMGVWLYETDLDLDGILDGVDNCPKLENVNQVNHDGDAFGDVCDDDDDNDGVEDESDDCPTGEIGWLSNANADHDGDGCRDINEDFDDDEDGVFDTNDLCPRGPIGWISTEENDIEGDGCADIDSDGDGWVDQADNCPATSNANQADLDNDDIGDVCDADKDGDGISIPDDNCPNDLNPWVSFSWNDYDEDGCLDETMDDDDDDDGVLDENDACLLGEKNWMDQAASMDHDGDGCADATEDDDDDNDGKDDEVDRCPKGLIGIAQAGQDLDDDGCIDAVEDDDDDQDGVLDPLDQCPRTDPTHQISSNGCSEFQLDDDNDGVENAFDFCLDTVANAIVDKQGCATGNLSPSGENDDEGWGLAGWLFLAAGVIVVWAVYNSNQRPGPPLPTDPVKTSPPPRPEMLGQDE